MPEQVAGAPDGGRAALRVLLAGGGTAGHVSPLLALADRLVADDPATQVLVVGTAAGIEARLVPARGYVLHEIARVPLPRRPSLRALRLPVDLHEAVRSARAAIEQVQAHVVVGFGGYVAAPAYLAAKRARIPIVVHEQNSRPGFANRLGARLTPWVAISFPDTPLRHAVHTGLPLRAEITELDRVAARPAACAAFGLDLDRRTVLVVGGSLGAAHLNETLPTVAPDLASRGVQVLHICGAGKTVAVGQRAPHAPAYVVREYVDQMELAYAAADLVVCRSGANTVSEVTALGLPAVFVPLPIGNGEQRLNALPVVRGGGGVLVDNADLDEAWLRGNFLPLIDDWPATQRMGEAAARFGRPDADRQLADLVRQAAAG